MTVKQLKEILKDAPDDNYVVIGVNTPVGYTCPDGAWVDVSSVSTQGIDWHFGLTELFPANRLDISDVEKWSKRINED